jgi:hypothetical protein
MKIHNGLVLGLIVVLMTTGIASAIEDTNISFSDINSINDVIITNTNDINQTVNITDNYLYIFDDSLIATNPYAQVYFTRYSTNITADLDVYPETNTSRFYIHIGLTDITLRFNASGGLDYYNGTAYVPITTYSKNTWQHLQIDHNSTAHTASINFSGIFYNITERTPSNILGSGYITFQTQPTEVPKYRIANLTIYDNTIPDIPTTIRKFPYPYKAAWTISSDIDSYNQTEFFSSMDFLNTNETIYEGDTLLGDGVGLDISHNFWIATDCGVIGYYQDYSSTECDESSIVLEYMDSGHLDTLHKWGSDPMNSSNNAWLKSIITLLKLNNINITTWINHGGDSQKDNIGLTSTTLGDDSDNSTWYHINETISNYTVKYIWDSQNTNYSYSSTAIIPITLNDSTTIFRFQRNLISSSNTPNNDNFSSQINEFDLNKTIRRKGYNIIYTHIGYNSVLGDNVPIFNSTAVSNLNIVKNHFYGTGGYSQDLYVTTLSKLLKYNEVSLYLNYTVSDNNFNITDINSPIGAWTPTVADLQGVTFYTASPATAKVYLNGADITSSTVQNAADDTGQTSIMFPITRPIYPFVPNDLYYGVNNTIYSDHINYSSRPLSTNTTNSTITPSSDNITIKITTWNTTHVVMNESSSNATNTVQYRIGDRTPLEYYKVAMFWNNGTRIQEFSTRANETGYLNYNSSQFDTARYTLITKEATIFYPDWAVGYYLAGGAAIIAALYGAYRRRMRGNQLIVYSIINP